MKWNEIGKDEWGNVILGAPQFLPDPTLKYLGGVWSHFQGIGALTLLLFVPSCIQNSTEKMRCVKSIDWVSMELLFYFQEKVCWLWFFGVINNYEGPFEVVMIPLKYLFE